MGIFEGLKKAFRFGKSKQESKEPRTIGSAQLNQFEVQFNDLDVGLIVATRGSAIVVTRTEALKEAKLKGVKPNDFILMIENNEVGADTDIASLLIALPRPITIR